jgi:NADPH:quinone reductase
MRGLRVLATGGSIEGREMLAAQHVEVFDHSSAGYEKLILERTDGRGVDLIVEMLANVNLGRDLTLLSRGGRAVVVGSRGPVEINPRDAMAREADIRGVFLTGMSKADLAEAWAALQAGLEAHAIAPVIAEVFPLAEAPRAHEAVMTGKHRGKIVLHCSDLQGVSLGSV